MKKIIVFLLLIIIIPIIIVNYNSENRSLKKKYGSYNKKSVKVKRINKNRIDNVLLEDYVVGVVAGEMPASFNIEALKAQAVTSRTYVIKRMGNNEYDVVDGSLNQVYLDEEDLKVKWKESYNSYIDKVREAVTDTKGEIILYDNEIVDAMFFSTSNGYTENSGDVFSSNKPYLVSVESKWDEKESPVFKSENKVKISEFLFNLGLNEKNVNIGEIRKTHGGRVKTIEINKKTFSGTKIREAFNLRSTSFNIKKDNEYVIFEVRGYGHGVGLSQYGANGMAKENNNYKDIIKYYFRGTQVKKVF